MNECIRNSPVWITHLRLFVVALWNLVTGDIDEAHFSFQVFGFAVKNLKGQSSTSKVSG